MKIISIALTSILFVVASESPRAESVISGDGIDIDRAILEVYLENRFGSYWAMHPKEDIRLASIELVDFYLLAGDANRAATEIDPSATAEIELRRVLNIALAESQRLIKKLGSRDAMNKYLVDKRADANLEYRDVVRSSGAPSQDNERLIAEEMIEGADEPWVPTLHISHIGWPFGPSASLKYDVRSATFEIVCVYGADTKVDTELEDDIIDACSEVLVEKTDCWEGLCAMVLDEFLESDFTIVYSEMSKEDKLSYPGIPVFTLAVSLSVATLRE